MNMAYLKIVLTLYLCGFCKAHPVVLKSPPPPSQVALMARYIVHNSDWVAIATISSEDAIKGYPFVGLKSLSDGTEANSTGVPYLYMTDRDVSGQDLEADKRVTIMATLAESDYCRTQDIDPQDPRCAKIIMTGTYIKINKSSPEYQVGQNFLFDRHPAMKTWPADHGFFVAKIDPIQIGVLDHLGAIQFVSKKDYFNANITNIINANVEFNRISVLKIGIINK